MRSNSLDSKLKAKEVELKRHEQEIADQDEVHILGNSCSTPQTAPFLIMAMFIVISFFLKSVFNFKKLKGDIKLFNWFNYLCHIAINNKYKYVLLFYTKICYL